MTIVLWLLTMQCILGGFDNLWHHEITERLPSKRSARREIALHSAREFLYAIIFLGIAWREWHGTWAWVLGGLLIIEVMITLADFIEEDRTRHLPALERVLHTVLALNFGLWLGVFIPHMLDWAGQTTALVSIEYGWFSVVFTLAAIGLFGWSMRNLYAALKHSRPPMWVRHPIYVGHCTKPRTLLVTGATGFIGSALVRHLLARGHAVIALTRDADKALDLFGPHVRVVQSLDAIDNATHVDGIVNLAGARILALPWFSARRRELLSSRLHITREIVKLCQRLHHAPSVLISGSAIGYYGVRNDESCDESEPAQARFQSELCQQWEQAALGARELGARVVLLRTGLVLGVNGGALPMMSLPIRLCTGSILGSGQQWMSWIHIEDHVRLIDFAINQSSLSGPLNATAPHPTRHIEFQRQLAKQLRRPLWMRVPAWCIRGLLGEMSELLIAGQRVVPHKASVYGFTFKYRTLNKALASLYSKQPLRIADGNAEVYFNGECPVCNAEMTHYAGIAKRKSLPLCFVDSIRQPESFSNYGLNAAHLEERLYVRDANGHILSGMNAILYVWKQLPNYKWAATLCSLPGLRHLSVAIYDLVVAPSLARWARRRVRVALLSERANSDATTYFLPPP